MPDGTAHCVPIAPHSRGDSTFSKNRAPSPHLRVMVAAAAVTADFNPPIGTNA
jgi:hypothetical protein